MTDHDITQEACLQADQFLVLLCALAKRYQLYGESHPRTIETCQEFDGLRRELRKHLPNNRLVIGSTEKRFYLANVPLLPHRNHTRLLRDSLDRRGMAGFVLSLEFRGVPKDLLAMLVQDKPPPHEKLPEGFRWLTRDERRKAKAEDSSNVLINLEGTRIDVELYDMVLSAVSNFFHDCERTSSGDIVPVIRAAETLVTEVNRRPEEILPRATVPYYAEFMVFHAVNTSIYLTAAASCMTDDHRWLTHLATAALVRDVGEALVPRGILYKGQELSPAEAWRIVEHPMRGVEILQEIPGVHPLVISATFGHHVKSHGHGYPEVSKEFVPGPFTKLLEVVDIFAALSSFRPHKRAITAPQAFTRIYRDPCLDTLKPYADLLVHAIGFHPVGTRVRFGDRRVGVVVDHPGGDPLRATVRLLEKTETGGRLGAERLALAGDVPWFKPPRDAEHVMRALGPLEDLDVVSEMATPVITSAGT